MTTRLALYNGALMECGEREIASLTENREPRRLLDRAWDNGFVDYCLGKAQWKFALRTTQLAPDTGIETDFGYRNAYARPTDHVRTAGMYSDEYCRVPLLAYTMEQGYVFADIEPLFWKYVSNSTSYGGDLAAWPAELARAAEVYLASRIAKKLTQSADEALKMLKLSEKLFLDASSGDAMEGPTEFPPPGNWVKARAGSTRRDRGNRGSLVG